MYKRNAQGWSKHFDFMVVDELSLQLAFVLAVFLRHREWAYASSLYRSLGLMLILADALVAVLLDTMHNVVSRGYWVELEETGKQSLAVFVLAAVGMFAAQKGQDYSRIILFVTFGLHVFFGYLLRLLWKQLVRQMAAKREKKYSMLVVSAPEDAPELLRRLSEDPLTDREISGLVLTEESGEKSIAGVPVVSDLDHAADYIVREWVDSVYIDGSLRDERIVKLIDDCVQMGVPTHFHVPTLGRSGVKRFSEKIGGTTVLTTSINYATPAEALLKRCFDIAAGLVGSLAALLIMAVVGPIIKKQSPGPILFAQERIGQNGRRFKMLKIRSMYLDAEERKQELMAQNRVKDGMMFKLDFDPRIIGNEILPDGTKKTGIGDFIRRTSLDEFPQFFLVLKGTMSTVGTRPPTPDEYAKYRYHHRARMSTKPGVTGLWQVSGRSEITDFEEVVRLDTEYITNWSVGEDLRILLQTVKVLFTRKGAM